VATKWSRPIGLLHLDGDHTYEGVVADLQAWLPHLTWDAVVALDDATDPALGPHRLIHDDLVPQGWTTEGPIDKMMLVSRRGT
jgi:hypothetical protein